MVDACNDRGKVEKDNTGQREKELNKKSNINQRKKVLFVFTEKLSVARPIFCIR